MDDNTMSLLKGWWYVEIPFIGAVYLERREPSSWSSPPWFEHRKDDGEHHVFLGKLYLIFTPIKRLHRTC